MAAQMASAMSAWPHLTTLDLASSTDLGPAAIEAVVTYAAPTLRTLDLSRCGTGITDRCQTVVTCSHGPTLAHCTS